MVGPYDQRLRLIIGNTANPKPSLHLIDVFIKFRPKRGILNIMDRPVKSLIAIYRHPTAPCPKVGMVIYPKKQIKYTILL
jgi:hypothetical protein